MKKKKEEEQNENVLEGFKCPKCGSLGPYKMRITTYCSMTDDGPDDHWEPDWDNDSSCECETCKYHGKVKDFNK